MQRFSGRLREVVAYKNQTTWSPFQEESPTHLLFGRELLLLHVISELPRCSSMLSLKVLCML